MAVPMMPICLFPKRLLDYALGWVAERAALVEPAACIWCSRCERICPTDAIGLPYVIRFTDSTYDKSHSSQAGSELK